MKNNMIQEELHRTMMTPEEMEQFILTSFPIFVRYLLAPQNEYGDRLMSDACDALVLVQDTFVKLRNKGIWHSQHFASTAHAFRYFRTCLKNAVITRYREEHAGMGDPQEREKERLRHINRTRKSQGRELLPELEEGEQFVMPQRFLTAHIRIEYASVSDEVEFWVKMEFQELEDLVIAQGLEKEWTLLQYKHGYGWSNERIAQELGYTADSVRSLAPRYMKRIRNVATAAGLMDISIASEERRYWERLNNHSHLLGFRVTGFKI